ncbi:hypothetical protein NYO98_06520 [Nocardioides sp. STR2]|uniref:Aminoglycoside phosphotransferase domain-containing protein n=1 Tax=Nocardioides pini TaxID=2975053 RepID=A0ABT4CAD1_9ACTN|nr:hypothetical protein [Nocardioides pini]MCY4725925.1 hypothetical protein [Nocardioides pini]
MNDDLGQHADAMVSALQERLRRHKLVFVQHGAVFEGLTPAIWARSGADVVDVADIATVSVRPQLHVSGLERYAADRPVGPTLGEVRQIVSALLGDGVEVCLWSTAPRVAFVPVPGSSLIDDASPFFLELLPVMDENPETIYPAVRHGGLLPAVYRSALDQLGVAVLASLDRAIYDAQLDRESLFEMLDPREVEALRGAGLAKCCEGDPYQLSAPMRFSELRDQLAATLAAQLAPQPELSDISKDLWTIERSIRLALRTAAETEFGPKWRSGVLHGDLSKKVLDRAMLDGFVSAKSVKELRDPIEWLTLGELIEVVTSAKFDNLGLLPIFWTKFAQDVVPVRNRLSHMRHFKHVDRGVVRMWVSQIARVLN